MKKQFVFNIKKAKLVVEYNEDIFKMMLVSPDGQKCRVKEPVISEIIGFLSREDTKLNDSVETSIGKATLVKIGDEIHKKNCKDCPFVV